MFQLYGTVILYTKPHPLCPPPPQEKTIAQSTHVSFPSLQLNTTYYYRVRAEVNSWTSVASPLVTATTPPPSESPVCLLVTVCVCVCVGVCVCGCGCV